MRTIYPALRRFFAYRLPSTISAISPGLWLALGVGLLFRLPAIFYGLPQQFDPDEPIFINTAGRMLAERTLDPGWYGAPGHTLVYALALLFGLYAGIGMVLGHFSGAADFGAQYFADVTALFVIGRAFTVSTALLCLWAVYTLTRQIGLTRFWSTVAALLTAAAPLLIEYSVVVRMDMLQAFFNLMTALFVLKAMASLRLRDIVYAGIFIGLAVATKFPGVVAVSMILGGVLHLYIAGRLEIRQAFTWLAAAGAASIAAAFAAAPFIFLKFPQMLIAVSVEARTQHLSATGSGFFPNMAYYLFEAMPDSFLLLNVFLGIAGLVYLAVFRRSWVVPIFFFGYVTFISSLSLNWARWIIPAVPFLTIGIVVLLERLEHTTWVVRIGAEPVRWVAATVVLLPVLWMGSNFTLARAEGQDTRDLATRWVHANISRGKTIMLETYAPALSTRYYNVIVAREGGLQTWQSIPTIGEFDRPTGFYGAIGEELSNLTAESLREAIKTAGIQYIILSKWSDRFAAESAVYPSEHAIYETLYASYTLIKTFTDKDAKLGPKIRVLRVEPPASNRLKSH